MKALSIEGLIASDRGNKDMSKKNDNVVHWEDQKHWGWIPMPFEKYQIKSDRILIEKGILSKEYDEVYLFRIVDVRCERRLGQRIFGTGTVYVISSDATTPTLKLENIPNAMDVKEYISKVAVISRRKHGILEHTSVSVNPTDYDGDGYPDGRYYSGSGRRRR